MANPSDCEQIKQIEKELLTNGPDAAAAKIQEYLDEWDNIPLNIAVTGETGSGKSTFVNAFRGILDEEDEGAAPTGCEETTLEVSPYPHPNYPSVKLWDLPGIGTPKFPADKYLKLVEFERFDFFIIISADRFRENDVKLAQEIQRMGKKFYFVCSKIDNTVRDEETRLRSRFSEERTLKQIRDNRIQGLEKLDIVSPQVFLVSSRHLHLYDFHLLEETLERDIPAQKRNTLLLAMPNVNPEIIRKKKEAFGSKIKYLASVSALIAAAPVPGVSFATDIAMLVSTVSQYQVTFGLHSKSLQSLARSACVPLADLRSVMTSPLCLNEINKELIIKILSCSLADMALMAAEEGFRYVPLFGIPAAASFSFISTYKALHTFLDMLAEDAQKVSKKALGFSTSV
ncbi:interferon-inducible GTPase 5-like [Epinephelus moara]|uniref:interferon-inducible GTPase 5-like n=1 Tax=Epinephelus moara TaxID=300413 RepID=UPI00214ED41D|nr:interferon-inducible GTPase 5-like [Epinephelus moara]